KFGILFEARSSPAAKNILVIAGAMIGFAAPVIAEQMLAVINHKNKASACSLQGSVRRQLIDPRH
ncbi:MAG: hypothetical protein II748_01930, partial [Clostridia bacterium]|nr:hypothetical protein [Clostridia bacterium]